MPTDLSLPKLSQTGTNEWADVEDNDVAIRTFLNTTGVHVYQAGTIETAAHEAKAVTGTVLADDVVGAYRTLLTGERILPTDTAATGGPFFLGPTGVTPSVTQQSGAASNWTYTTTTAVAGQPGGVPLVYLDDADYAIAGRTTKLRVRGIVLANATAPAINFTFALHPITVAGAADTVTYYLGTATAGSTAVATTPSASTVTAATGTDFTIPADGAYALGVTISGTLANNSAVSVHAQLQLRHV